MTILSVVIPIGPGEREAAGLLQQLRDLPMAAEVILAVPGAVAEAGAQEWPIPVTLVVAEGARRAGMLNAGAARARGVWLWFLHADTRLLPGSLAALAAFLGREQQVLGWFALRFRADGPWLTRLNALGANLRSRWFGVPFGDQGFVLRAVDFHTLGGFDESAAYGEDHLFVWTARAGGIRARPVGGRVATSARKYARHGWARTTLLHWRLTMAQAWPGWRRSRRPSRA